MNAKQRQRFNFKQQCVLPTLIIRQRCGWRGAATTAVGFRRRYSVFISVCYGWQNAATAERVARRVDGRAGGRDVSVRVVTRTHVGRPCLWRRRAVAIDRRTVRCGAVRACARKRRRRRRRRWNLLAGTGALAGVGRGLRGLRDLGVGFYYCLHRGPDQLWPIGARRRLTAQFALEAAVLRIGFLFVARHCVHRRSVCTFFVTGTRRISRLSSVTAVVPAAFYSFPVCRSRFGPRRRPFTRLSRRL